MKNKKYILANSYIDYPEACLELLNAMQEEGYQLIKVGFFFVFEKTDKKLKYQIDYTERDIEYNEIVEELGYFHIGSDQWSHFYASEDLNAPDLITDEVIFQRTKLKRFNLVAIFCFFFMGVLQLMINPPILKSYLSSPVSFYLNVGNFIGRTLLIFMAIYFIGMGCLEYYKRSCVLNHSFSYQKFRKYDIASNLILTTFLILYVCMYYYFQISFGHLFDLFIGFCIAMIPIYIHSFWVSRIKVKQIRFFASSICIIAMYLIISTSASITLSKMEPKAFPYYQNISEIEDNRYVFYVRAIPHLLNEDAYSTVYLECASQEIMDAYVESWAIQAGEEIFETELVDYCTTTKRNELIEVKFVESLLYVHFEVENEADIESIMTQYLNYYRNHSNFKQN